MKLIDKLKTKQFGEAIKGSPIQGEVKKKHTSPLKKLHFFFLLVLQVNISAQFRFVLLLASVTSVLSVHDQCITDTHQSPIGIKAVLLYYNISPWSISGPQKTTGSMPCPIIMSQILWLLTNPMKAHDIGESDRLKQNNVCIYIISVISVGAADSNQVLWIFTNPYTGSLLQPFLLFYYRNSFS